MKKTITVLIILILVLLLLFAIFRNKPTDVTAVPSPTTTVTVSTSETINISSPTANTRLSSPLTITGTAPGNWFFEASFPISLRDSNGTEIGRGVAQAIDDWMQAGPVRFKAVITFAKPTSEAGTLVFKNDNPSGDPARDKMFVVPVLFDLTPAQTTTSTRTVETVTASVRIAPTGR